MGGRAGRSLHMENREAFERLYPEEAARYEDLQFVAGLDPRTRAELDAVAEAVRGGTVGTQSPDGRTSGPVVSMENREAFERLYPEEAARYEDLQFVAGLDPRVRAELDASASAVREGTVGRAGSGRAVVGWAGSDPGGCARTSSACTPRRRRSGGPVPVTP